MHTLTNSLVTAQTPARLSVSTPYVSTCYHVNSSADRLLGDTLAEHRAVMTTQKERGGLGEVTARAVRRVKGAEGKGLWIGCTHSNTGKGVSGKVCLLLSPKITDHQSISWSPPPPPRFLGIPAWLTKLILQLCSF